MGIPIFYEGFGKCRKLHLQHDLDNDLEGQSRIVLFFSIRTPFFMMDSESRKFYIRHDLDNELDHDPDGQIRVKLMEVKVIWRKIVERQWKGWFGCSHCLEGSPSGF